MIRSILIQPDGARKTGLTETEFQAALKDPDALLWISLEHPTADEAARILSNTFHFHPLTIDDCLNSGYQTPKVDDFRSYIFIIAHALQMQDSANLTELDTSELNIFLGANYLVTVFLDERMTSVDHLWSLLERDERLTQHGSDFLCHSLLDILVDEYMPVLDQLDDEIELLEDLVLAHPTNHLLQQILEIKHVLMSLRRIMSPQREVMNRLSRDEYPMIDAVSRIYFRDVYDHLVRFQDLVESLRDIVSGSMDIYLNSNSLRMNEIMKALTIVSTIFLPLSFIAGMFGMNFTHMIPPWDWQYGYALFWLICIVIAGGMLIYFKRKGWF